MELIALAILKDLSNNTVGALISVDGKHRRFKTCDMLDLKKNGIPLENAVIDINGFIRSKKGKLDTILIKAGGKINLIEQNEIRNAQKIIKEKTLRVYHGTVESNLHPTYGIGKVENDYGLGFYTTPNKVLGMEWSYNSYSKSSSNIHYCYEYEIDTADLKILDFTEISSLHWIAELLKNRKIDTDLISVSSQDIEEFIEYFKIDTRQYDIIIGYRADDSYFSYIKLFVSNNLGIGILENILRLGDLGLQIDIKSKKAINRLKLIEKIEVPNKFSSMYKKRVDKARNDYDRLIKENSRANREGCIREILDRQVHNNL